MAETIFYNSKNLVGIGSVGIGTMSPSSAQAGSLLDVYASGTSVSSNVSISAGCDGSASSTNKSSVIFNIKGAGGGIVTGAMTHQLLGSDYSFNFQPQTLGTSVMVVKGGGNVGIGLTNPTAPFHLYYSKGGPPVTSGTADSNVAHRIQGGTVVMDTGVYENGITWFQARSVGSFATNYATVFAPNGSYIGIGNTTPQRPLHVLGEICQTPTVGTNVIYNLCDINGSNGGNYTLYIRGLNGGGTSEASLAGFYVNTSVATFSGLAGGSTRALYVTAAGALTITPSDQRLKTNVFDINYGLETVLSLRPVSYNWINVQSLGANREIGFLAQEVRPFLPEVVGENLDGTFCLDYAKLTAVLTKAVQELSTKLQNSQNEIDLLKSRLAAIEAKLA